MQRVVWLFAVALGVSLVAPGVASAGFILTGFDKFVGTQAGDDPADGTVNFAVYDNVNGDFFLPTTDATPGVPVVQEGTFTGRYIYLYQVVNTSEDGGTDDALDTFQINVRNANKVNGIGYFSMQVFNEAGVGPVDGSNPELNGPLDGTDPITHNGSAINPLFADIDNVDNDVSWLFFPSGPPFNGFGTIPTGGTSTILFLTSDLGPVSTDAFVTDGSIGVGYVPAPTPLPSGLALLLSAVPGLAGLMLLHRRRATETLSPA